MPHTHALHTCHARCARALRAPAADGCAPLLPRSHAARGVRCRHIVLFAHAYAARISPFFSRRLFLFASPAAFFARRRTRCLLHVAVAPYRSGSFELLPNIHLFLATALRYAARAARTAVSHACATCVRTHARRTCIFAARAHSLRRTRVTLARAFYAHRACLTPLSRAPVCRARTWRIFVAPGYFLLRRDTHIAHVFTRALLKRATSARAHGAQNLCVRALHNMTSSVACGCLQNACSILSTLTFCAAAARARALPFRDVSWRVARFAHTWHFLLRRLRLKSVSAVRACARARRAALRRAHRVTVAASSGMACRMARARVRAVRYAFSVICVRAWLRALRTVHTAR